jgi:mannose-6-phosphate isomerase-like protein (cupin superfamily)
MSLKPNEEIGMEVHPDNDQFFRVEEGEGKAIIDGNEYNFSKDFCIIIPAGSEHNIINTSTTKDLKVYTIYSPAHHKDKTIHETKQDAINSDEEFDGVTTE